jgi:hypothetical protein
MKHFHLLVLLFALIGATQVQAQTRLDANAARPTAMANAYVSQSGIWSLVHNQAGLTSIEKPTLAVSYQSRFSLKQLSTNSIMVALPTAAGNFGIDFHRLGWKNWNESNLSAAFARTFGNRFSAALAFRLYTSKIPAENINLAMAGVDLGAQYALTEKTSLGLHLSDPLTANISGSESENVLPASIRLGGHTQFGTAFLLSYEAFKTDGLATAARIGTEWSASPEFKIRAGISTTPYRFVAGIGYNFDFLETDLAFAYHQYLGVTPSISVRLSLP